MPGGFMSGFGKAFSSSFEQGMARLDQTKRDNFRVAYDKFNDVKSKYDQEETAWKTALKSAETIISSSGSDIPPEAAPKVAELLMAGYTIPAIEEKLKTNKFDIAPIDVAGGPLTVDDQMEESGLAPPISPQVEEPADGPIMKGVKSIFPNAGQSPEQNAANRVMTQTGTSQEQFDQYNAGFQQPDTSNITMTPKDLDEAGDIAFKPGEMLALIKGVGMVDVAMKNADGSITTATGEQYSADSVTKVASPDVFGKEEDLYQQLGPASREINEQGSSTASLLYQMAKADRLVQENGNAISGIAILGGQVEDIFREVGIGADMLGTNLTDPQLKALEQQYASRAAQALPDDMFKDGKDAQFLRGQMWSIVMQVARTQQGSGQLSGRDVVDAFNQVFTTNKPEDFRRNLHEMGVTAAQKFDQLSSDFVANDGQVRVLIERYPSDIARNMFSPIETRLDEETAKWYGNTDFTQPISSTTPPEIDPNDPPPPEVDPALWAVMDEADKALFR